MTKDKIARLSVLICALLICALYAYFGDTNIRQLRRIAIARDHVSVIKEAIVSTTEYSKVDVGVTTAGGGCILVYGCVSSDRYLNNLKKEIDNTKPPVNVVYAIQVQQ